MKLAGKVAIVTGSGQGIGEAIAIKFASEGAAVVVNDIDIAKANQVTGKIKSQGGEAIAFKADVAVRREVHNLIENAIENFKAIHVLVNNAGITRHAPLLEITEEEWDITLSVDLKGVFLCTQAVLPYMIKKEYGKIVNISSVAGIGHGRPGMAAYAAAKAGVVQLTKITAREVGKYGINVNCICPGNIVTPMIYARRSKKEAERLMEDRKKLTVLGRIGTTEEMANAVLFLASDDSSFIAGQVLSVNGGRTDAMP